MNKMDQLVRADEDIDNTYQLEENKASFTQICDSIKQDLQVIHGCLEEEEGEEIIRGGTDSIINVYSFALS